MKQKLFTLLTLLVLCVTGAWAQDFTYALSSFTVTNTTYTYEFSENALKNKTAWVEVPSSTSEGTITFKAGSTKSDRYLYIYKTNGTVKDDTRRVQMTSGWATGIDFTSSDILTSADKYYLVFSTSDDFKTTGVRYTLTDPSGLEISPASGTYAGNVSVTMSANDGYTIYYTDNGSEPTKSSTIYAGSFDVTSNKTIKAIAYKGENYGFIQTAEYIIVPENRLYDFTALTSGDLTALQGNTDAFSDDTSNKIISNKVQWNSNTDYALESSDGTDISVAQYLLFGRSGNNISAGNFRYYYGDSKYVYYNNSNTYVKIPGVNAGQKVILEMSASGDRTISATNTTVSELSYTASGVKKLTFIASANGEVKLSFNGNLSIYSIEVKTPVYYTVTYNLNGGTGTLPTETDKEEGDKFDLHDGTTDITAPTGKVFDGWKDQDENTYDGGAEYTMPAKNVTLTAQWRTPAVKHTVTYDLNGGTGTVPTQEDVEEGANFEVASGTTGITAPENKRFSTWNDGTTDYAPGDSYPMGTSDVTLTAQWVDVYVVSKTTPEHGTIAVSPATAAAGDVVTLTATPEFRYQLDAWNVYKTGEPATTVTVTDNKFTMPAYAVTVEASFVADARKQILYLTSDGTVDASDKLFEALGEDYTITKAAYNASKTVTDFDLVVFHESIGGGNAKTGLVKAAIEGAVPVLNTKSYFYSDGRWGWGTPDAGKSVKGCTLNPAIRNVASHPIFSGVTIDGSNFLEITDEAAAKTMQPVTPVAGKEGYLLATSPLSSTGNATAIHELTPAQRGVASGKYLLISVSSAKLNELNANGKKLFQNAAAYLMGDDAWTPTITTNAGKWTSYTPGCNVTLQDGATAYFITDVTGSTITATPVTVLKAGEGYFVKGAAASTAYTATATNEDADATTGTLMVGQLASTTINTTTPDGNDKYVLGTATSGANNGKSGLFKVSGDVTVGAGKAYLNTGATGGAHSLSLNFDENGDVTGIQVVEVQKELLEGDFYNLKGQKVAQPTKGLYIVNGRKVVMK